MNKRYFTALIATFLMAVSAIAQTNTYNMVLTLTDGTVITIGPNDLKQLDFKEGDVTVSGTNITDLMNSIKDMQALLAAVKKQVDITQMYVEDAVGQINKNKDDISSLKASVKDLNESVDALNKSVDAKIADNYYQMKTYTDQAMKNTEADLKKYTNEAVNKLHAEIAENKEVITNEYHEAIDESKAEILVLINANTANIETNAAGINKNKDAIIELVKKLREAGIRI